MPISDGGDGFIDCMYQILKAKDTTDLRRVRIEVRDPLMTQRTTSEYLVSGETAWVEVANSAGL